jgi:hypothetical protein
MSDVPTESTTVELSIPAVGEWLALARTTGASVASHWQFTYDEIADLRLAIDELCLTVIAAGGESFAPRLYLVYSLEGSAIVVRARIGSAAPGIEVEETVETHDIAASAELSARILDALVDEHGSQADSLGHSAWLRKERSVMLT